MGKLEVKRDKKALPLINKFSLPCEARAMKTQLNETGQNFAVFFIMGIASKMLIFLYGDCVDF